jgi:hypothetical protein
MTVLMMGTARKRAAPARTAQNINGNHDVITVVTNSANGTTRSSRSHRYTTNQSVPKSLFGLVIGSKTKKSSSTKQQFWTKTRYVLGVALFVVCGFLFLYFSNSTTSTILYVGRQQGTRRTETIVNKNFSVLLPSDLLQPTTTYDFVLPTYHHKKTKHYYDGLELEFLDSADFRVGRIIYNDGYDEVGYDELWNATDDDGYMESYYAFDDDEYRSPLNRYDDPDIHLRKKCRRTNWHRQQPLSCNIVHEYDFQNHVLGGDTKYVR